MGYNGIVGKETTMTEKTRGYTLVAVVEFADGGVLDVTDFGDFATQEAADKAAMKMAKRVKREEGGKTADGWAVAD